MALVIPPGIAQASTAVLVAAGEYGRGDPQGPRWVTSRKRT